MKNFTLLFISSLAVLHMFGQDISGPWYGVLKVNEMQLHLVFNVKDSGDVYISTMDSPDQGANGIAVSKTSFHDSLIKFDLVNLGINYEGKLGSSNTISGIFRQAGREIPLVLSKEKTEIVRHPRPQEPQKPYPYYAEDVHFLNPKADIVLAGTLTMPQKEGNFPAVILITGSGPQNRDEELLGHKPFLVLSDYLTRRGIAVLRVDDRGTFESKGIFKTATSMDFSTDVEAALDYLLTRKEINKKEIGLVGHSEGGLIAPMVASRRKDVSFIVLLAGPGISGERILLMQEALISRASGKPEDEIKDMSSISRGALEMIVNSGNLDTLKKELTAYLGDRIKNDSLFAREAGDNKEQFIAGEVKELATPWMQYFIRYDPAPTLEKVMCPVLALDGSKDLQVPPETDLEAIKAALRKGGNNQVTTMELPNLNHLFQECNIGSPAEYAKIEQTFSPIALDEISKWILKQVK
jgi:uncharacterized protein